MAAASAKSCLTLPSLLPQSLMLCMNLGNIALLSSVGVGEALASIMMLPRVATELPEKCIFIEYRLTTVEYKRTN